MDDDGARDAAAGDQRRRIPSGWRLQHASLCRIEKHLTVKVTYGIDGPMAITVKAFIRSDAVSPIRVQRRGRPADAQMASPIEARDEGRTARKD